MFNLQRFLRLTKAQWAEHRKSYLWFFLIGIIVHFCTLATFSLGGTSLEFLRTDTQMAIYMVGFFITAPLFAGRYLEKISSRDSALTVLMRPASIFEKFLLAFLIIAVFYPIAYTVAYQVCNFPASLFAVAAADAAPPYNYLATQEYGTYMPFVNSKTATGELPLLMIVWTLQAYMLAGTLFFKRFAMLKSFVLGFVILLGIVFIGNVFSADPERLFHVWNPKKFMPPGFYVWMVVVWVAVPVLTWLSAFYFFKERELH
jgi:ABC-type uncharacterized transport system fused permease/ATPase subunit